jgi:hypothetical protein
MSDESGVVSQSSANGTSEAFADCKVDEISLQAIHKLIEKSSILFRHLP